MGHAIFDLLFLAFGVLMVIICAKTGFFLSLLKFCKLLLAVVAAYPWGDAPGAVLSKPIFYTPIRNSIFEKINGVYQKAAGSFQAETALEAIPGFLKTDAMVQKLNGLEGEGEALVHSISDSVAGALSSVVSSIVGFLLVFAIAFLVLTVAYWFLKGFRSKLGLISLVDTILGALLGLLLACIVLFAVGSLMKFFFASKPIYANSILVKFFGDSFILNVLKFLNINQWLSKLGQLIA